MITGKASGLLLTPCDIDLWGDAIIELSRNAKKHTQMEWQGRDWVVRRFNTWEIGKEFELLFESDA